ncbi:hypothetical protein KC959_01660 [Candidatus Saccharibacteria bacterium]|nr:hypothetical protein [Candidatus Saccharibacteria bacterium]
MSNLATAEQLIYREAYAHSMQSIRALGGLALEAGGIEKLPQDSGVFRRVWNDFYTAVEENLATDPEYGEKLVWNKFMPRRYESGHVRTEDGGPVVDMVKNGWLSSLKAAETDDEMAIQAERDEGDVLLAEEVDTLEVGEMLCALSLDPKDAIKRNRRYWEDEMYYREGMAVLQVYYRSKEDEVLTGVFAIKRSNRDAIRQIFAENDVDIPANISDSYWIRHAIRQKMTVDEVKQFGNAFRKRHREIIKDAEKEFSVTEFMGLQAQTVQQFFTYLEPLSIATHSGKNNETLQSLAHELSKVSSLDSDVRRHLIKIANSSHFNDNDARQMEDMIRYALVEELRKKLPAYMDERARTPLNQMTAMVVETNYARIVHGAVLQQQQLDMARHIARNVAAGSEAGRTYGGCSGAGSTRGKLGADSIEEEIPGLQDVYGGKLNKGEETSSEEDEFGPLEFKCTKGHKNTRPRGKLIPHCKTCGENVSCAPDQEKEVQVEEKQAEIVTLFARKSNNERIATAA